jgi:membrane-associated protease RseP (regulator of RpoE activity)
LIIIVPLLFLLLLPTFFQASRPFAGSILWMWAALFFLIMAGWMIVGAGMAAPPAPPRAGLRRDGVAPPAGPRGFPIATPTPLEAAEAEAEAEAETAAAAEAARPLPPLRPPPAIPAFLPPSLLAPEQVPDVVRRVMEVHVGFEHGGTRIFQGPLPVPPDDAFDALKRSAGEGIVPMLQADERYGATIILMPKPAEMRAMERRTRPWVNWGLFVATILTTTWAGAAHQGVDLLRQPGRFAVGLPYALGLLSILGVHELGHFFAARYHGMNVTPPFFIPVPFGLGTFGAFIQMRSPPENRRALFDVAVAGPLAGLVIAIPATLIGLRQSSVIPFDASLPMSQVHGTSAGSSLLFAMLAKLSLGEQLQESHLVQLSPLAFAGWLGLFITALNLLPVGQLDGGHTARAMFGTRVGNTISTVAMWSLLLLAIFVWPGLMMWALIVFFFIGRGTPPLNDLSPVTPGRRLIGYLAFLILLLILVPLPHEFWPEAGIRCPYL